ncbi:MAG TPA: DNA methyltransferase [Pilimelia sp.]|nr:DNA methyltransferase [Pilimelia sp.]
MPDSRHGFEVARSVWVTGQVCSRDQRRGRYTKASMAHPGKMLPAIARYLIATYTNPGDLVLDPMAGIGTTIVEAMHLGRHGIGVEYEARWANLAAENITLATAQGATGTGAIHVGDSRHLTSILAANVRGNVALVITSPPYGPSTHGHVRTPGSRHGKVRKLHNRYGADKANLAYRDHDELAAGFTQILAACAEVLASNGRVAVTARPYRRNGELIDIPGMVLAAGMNAGLQVIDRCPALIAGMRDGALVPRGSFFQLRNIRSALEEGDPQWLVAHEDVLVFAGATTPLSRSVAP